ncbi:hypothetical protein UU9_07616 [Rhodanobacter fulvus Jip2]|uniref:Secreted protein n=1 Tax=Rhodanobacter fulvus Jip2 TaxID=1163408 RepID=I4VS75_9GAMM|nr:hypothetical protein UU9_07616 [Rhodanobacter fulvus Jip2]
MQASAPTAAPAIAPLTAIALFFVAPSAPPTRAPIAALIPGLHLTTPCEPAAPPVVAQPDIAVATARVNASEQTDEDFMTGS